MSTDEAEAKLRKYVNEAHLFIDSMRFGFETWDEENLTELDRVASLSQLMLRMFRADAILLIAAVAIDRLTQQGAKP